MAETKRPYVSEEHPRITDAGPTDRTGWNWLRVETDTGADGCDQARVPTNIVRIVTNELSRLSDIIRDRGRCLHCGGDGHPNCVSCHNYQGCICRPGEGSKADHCWACGGSGLDHWAYDALISSIAPSTVPSEEQGNE